MKPTDESLARSQFETDDQSLTLRYTVTDHLGTPFLQTDAAAQIVWRAEYEPYGTIATMRAGSPDEQPLRFPGQEASLDGAESYNIFRWYRAEWGRYTQTDPLLQSTISGRFQQAKGREGAVQSYGYVSQNPLRFADPKGLRKCASGRCPDCPSGWWTVTQASLSIFALFGGSTGTFTSRCLGADRTCRYGFWCFDVGYGVDIGVGIQGGLQGGIPENAPVRPRDPSGYCNCAEDFAGWGIGVSGSVGVGIRGGSAGVGFGGCTGFGIGAGLGIGAAIKANAYCMTYFIACD